MFLELPRFIISAWATEQHLSLGQLKVDDKANEITAVPKLLDSLLLKGAIVTLYAMGCQRLIAKQIKAQEADYVIAVKENQGRLYQSLQKTFLQAETQQFSAMTYSIHETVDGDRGHMDAPLIANAIRAHWRLDVIFKEDLSRIRTAHAPENVGWLRRFALTLLKKEYSFKASIRRKRLKPLWITIT